ncbi:hypothetical protein IF1G_09193 [Cordyceps javanica]|uniref:Uncharacterized protein n=1 Tax=Cordyceps javanica TaxID=43265 RepID=A0A545URN0_9HYPO|nr:hypothetical protein IF1G_09193 [Cordyceps javanica]
MKSQPVTFPTRRDPERKPCASYVKTLMSPSHRQLMPIRWNVASELHCRVCGDNRASTAAPATRFPVIAAAQGILHCRGV